MKSTRMLQVHIDAAEERFEKFVKNLAEKYDRFHDAVGRTDSCVSDDMLELVIVLAFTNHEIDLLSIPQEGSEEFDGQLAYLAYRCWKKLAEEYQIGEIPD